MSAGPRKETVVDARAAVKNMTTRCEGLAPGLFLFAILGNGTYALSIVVASMERNYLIRNASWLAGIVSTYGTKGDDVLTDAVGSALTIFLDLIVRVVVIHAFAQTG